MIAGLGNNTGLILVWVVNRFTYPSTVGVKTTLGGYAIESGDDLNPVVMIHTSGIKVIRV